MSKPVVSIIFISWNHQKFIKQAIQSVAEQTFKNFEIIYLDNCSNDGTFEYALRQFEIYGLKIRAFQNESPQSISKNLNYLIKESQGKYIAPLSGDDWWAAHNLEKKVKFFDEHPEVGLLYGGGFVYYDDTQTMERVPLNNFRSGNIFEELLTCNFIFGIGNMVPKKVYEELGFYDTNLLIEDWDMWLRIAQKYTVGFIPENLVYYRKHSNSFSTPSLKFLLNDIQTVKKWKRYPEAAKLFNTWVDHYIYEKARKEPSLKNNVEFLRLAPVTPFRFRQLLKNNWNSFKNLKRK